MKNDVELERGREKRRIVEKVGTSFFQENKNIADEQIRRLYLERGGEREREQICFFQYLIRNSPRQLDNPSIFGFEGCLGVNIRDVRDK